jgi:hypothetical protein
VLITNFETTKKFKILNFMIRLIIIFSRCQKLHLIRWRILIVFVIHLLDFFSRISIRFKHGDRGFVLEVFHDDSGRSVKGDFGAYTDV